MRDGRVRGRCRRQPDPSGPPDRLPGHVAEGNKQILPEVSLEAESNAGHGDGPLGCGWQCSRSRVSGTRLWIRNLKPWLLGGASAAVAGCTSRGCDVSNRIHAPCLVACFIDCGTMREEQSAAWRILLVQFLGVLHYGGSEAVARVSGHILTDRQLSKPAVRACIAIVGVRDSGSRPELCERLWLAQDAAG